MLTRYTADQKAAVLRTTDKAVARTGWSVRRVLKRLGVPRSVYYEWRERAVQKRLDDLMPGGRCLSAVLTEEKDAVISYALAHPKEGYRRLAWMMVDADVAYVSPASVYRILTDADLLYRWKRSCRSGEKPEAPTRPHQRWHTDIMYLRVADVSSATTVRSSRRRPSRRCSTSGFAHTIPSRMGRWSGFTAAPGKLRQSRICATWRGRAR